MPEDEVIVLMTEKTPRDGVPARVKAVGPRDPYAPARLVDDLRDAARLSRADAEAWIADRPAKMRAWLPTLAPADAPGLPPLPGGPGDGEGRQANGEPRQCDPGQGGGCLDVPG
jgi:hypothetical protein